MISSTLSVIPDSKLVIPCLAVSIRFRISKFCNSKFAVALNSGTDALTLAMHVCGVRRGDEVITTPNSFIASTATIVHLGAKPIFVDVLNDQNIDPKKIERVISKKTKCIMPVHLTGRMADMKSIVSIAKKYKFRSRKK